MKIKNDERKCTYHGIKKRRIHQDHQALLLERMRIDKLPIIEEGMVVTIRVDRDQTASLPTCGIVCIFYKKSILTSIKVVTEIDILVDHQNYPLFVPFGKYTLRPNDSPLNEKLSGIKKQILDGIFNPEKYPKTTIAKYCRDVYGGTTGLWKCKCNFKIGCGKNCSCKRANIKCNHKCGCLGDCREN